MLPRTAVLVLLAALPACAARTPSLAPAELARAQALVREGCYDCLLEARAIYDAAPASRRRAVQQPLFEIELLLAMREKELAIDPSATVARARAAAEGLPPSLDTDAILQLVEFLPEDATGRRILPPAERRQFDDSLALVDRSPLSPIVRGYLRLSLQCGRVPVDAATPIAERETPLISYRLAICDNPIQTAPLQAVRKAVPRFVETSFFLGRAAMGSLPGTDGRQASGLFEEAYARFPESPAITFNLATVYQATGDCRRGEDFFSRTLALRDGHIEARLGRAICRTYLSKPEDAIADASILIDGRASNRAEAYYWRAWNRRHLKQIELARADIDQARALRYNAQVLTLAGMIEHDQREFDRAREDLTRARSMDPRECQARWYLGLVGYATEAWAESADGFADAADCYARAIAETEAQRGQMAKRDDVSEEFRARQLAGFDAAIAEDSSQKSAADLNAAINYARARDVEKATTYMKRAAVDPQRRSAVEDLRQVLGVPRW
jgi:tetratricopeptide (TPR) repeat protein